VIRGLAVVCIGVASLTAFHLPGGLVTGRVVDLDGKPIAAVQIRHGSLRTSTGVDGRFRLSLPAGPGWLEASRAGYASALRPVQPGLPLLLRLSPADSDTVVLHAVGDVMAGRRFFSGDPMTHQPPQLLPGDGVAAHERLLQAVQPLLARADLTLLNLESPLLPDPVAERQGFRAAAFHPTKDYVFASSLALPAALQRAGVDMVGLANNHIFDALDPGLTSTLETLHLAGFRSGVGMFGAGSTIDQAWLPALRRVGGQTLSVLGCTTIHGSQHPVSYVASAEQSKPGAALCEARRLSASVRAAHGRGPVVVMLHGGNEYQSEPTPPISQMVEVARRAGATLVLIHHSHVLGGFHWDGRSLVALGLGNFLFDQTLWSTVPVTVAGGSPPPRSGAAGDCLPAAVASLPTSSRCGRAGGLDSARHRGQKCCPLGDSGGCDGTGCFCSGATANALAVCGCRLTTFSALVVQFPCHGVWLARGYASGAGAFAPGGWQL